MVLTINHNCAVVAEHKGAREVIAWKDPEGHIVNMPELALHSFARNGMTLSDAAKRKVRNAVNLLR